jgi:hypothetical protein
LETIASEVQFSHRDNWRYRFELFLFSLGRACTACSLSDECIRLFSVQPELAVHHVERVMSELRRPDVKILIEMMAGAPGSGIEKGASVSRW